MSITTVDRLSIADAVQSALWCQQAYSNGPFPAGTRLIDCNPAVDVQALVIEQPDFNVIAFRGTHDMTEWMIDFSVKLVKVPEWPLIKVHAGFHGAAMKAWPKLYDALDSKPIIITGHSLGGALARQTAYLAKSNRKNVLYSISFGEPRSFNRAGALAYDALGIPTWRVIDEDDIVCRVPFWPYWHCGNSAFYDVTGQVLINQPWWSRLPSDIAVWWSARLSKSGNPLVSDHSIERYVDRLRSIQNSLNFDSNSSICPRSSK